MPTCERSTPGLPGPSHPAALCPHLLASATLCVATGQACSCPGTCTGRALPGCLLPSSPGQPQCCLRPEGSPSWGLAQPLPRGLSVSRLGNVLFCSLPTAAPSPAPHSCRSRWAQAAVAQAPLSAPSCPESGPGWRGAGSAQPCCRPHGAPREALRPLSVRGHAPDPSTQCHRTGGNTHRGAWGPALKRRAPGLGGQQGWCAGQGQVPLSTHGCTHVCPQACTSTNMRTHVQTR